MSADGDGRVHGVFVAESLGPDAELRDLGILVDSVTRVRPEDAAPGQPGIWTMITFAAEESRADHLAEVFAKALRPGPWYIDFHSEATTYVVFAGKAFRYATGDAEGRGLVVNHARAVGVPEQQLDWR
ncbi:hypothetical protein ACWEVD_04765 [Nocardia thailandica]|uniref:Uncharacterized protein n=1 Tax=Nocardia thailandica TaxID=257275 RepID=A0ABW6PVE0_9NOCA|nr:hypothetical protein [Nocardia thailandica]